MWECVVRAHPMPKQIIIYAVGEPKRIKCSNDKSILRRYIAPKTWAIHKSDLINQQSLSCSINFLKELSSVCDFLTFGYAVKPLQFSVPCWTSRWFLMTNGNTSDRIFPYDQIMRGQERHRDATVGVWEWISNSSHTLLSMWLLLQAGIKSNLIQ